MARVLVILCFIIIVGLSIASLDDSKSYWENVGPSWDKMLNPCKYQECK